MTFSRRHLIYCLLVFVGIGFHGWATAQTMSPASFSRTVIARPRSSPPLHYWNGMDDLDHGVVVLTPTAPVPNGFGVIIVDSFGWNSHKDSYWVGDKLNQFQQFLRAGYTVFIAPHPPNSNRQLPPNEESDEPGIPGYIIPERFTSLSSNRFW